MSAFSQRQPTAEQAGIDLTPMLDVVFIMLIFFIVTASFIRELSVEIERPPEGPASTIDDNPNMVVRLTGDNQIMIDNRRIDHRSLRAWFERHKAAHPDAALIIRANNLAKTYAVVRITDAARQAQIDSVVLQTTDQQSAPGPGP